MLCCFISISLLLVLLLLLCWGVGNGDQDKPELLDCFSVPSMLEWFHFRVALHTHTFKKNDRSLLHVCLSIYIALASWLLLLLRVLLKPPSMLKGLLEAAPLPFPFVAFDLEH